MSATLETYPDRAAWLAARSKGIGASESARVLGITPNPTAVWLQKTGRVEPPPPTIPMRVGAFLEPQLLEFYEEKTGITPARFVQSSMLRSDEYPWMTTTLDALCPDGILELKTSQSHEGWGQEGTDQIPFSYLVQVHHQMVVAGHDRAHVAALIRWEDFRIYEVERDEDLAALIIGATGVFWREHVVADAPPDDDAVTPAQLILINRECEGTIDLPEEVLWAVDAVEDLRSQFKKRDADKDRATSRILKAMGTAKFGRLPDGRMIKRFAEFHPERVSKTKAHHRHYYRLVNGDRSES